MQARLKEAESQCALKEMQDKILDMEKVRDFLHLLITQLSRVSCKLDSKCIFLTHQRNTSLPDDTNVARLQEELIGVKLREAEALTGLKELRQQVRDLEEHWQVSIKISRIKHLIKILIRKDLSQDANTAGTRHTRMVKCLFIEC